MSMILDAIDQSHEEEIEALRCQHEAETKELWEALEYVLFMTPLPDASERIKIYVAHFFETHPREVLEVPDDKM